MVTPFRADGAADFERFRELATFLVDNGSDGLVVCGTTGESPTLSDAEKLDLFRVAVDEVGGRATVIAGTGTYDTRHSAALTKEATELGVDAVHVVTPYYSKPPQQALGDPEQARFIAGETRLDLYSGDDPNTFAFLELGGVGVVSVTAHLWGPQIAEMIRRHRDGDVEGARALHEEQQPSYDLLRIQTNPTPIKAALNLTGPGVGRHRLPMVEPDEAELAQIRSCLERSGLLAAASA